MGKKDTQGVRAGPIDGYRKQIGIINDYIKPFFSFCIVFNVPFKDAGACL